ncbi:MAG: hypothetical protein V1715_11170, partial [bacterium]
MFYDKIIHIIDKDISNRKLTKSSILLLSDTGYYRYFFDELFRIADGRWIPILIDNGLLTFDEKYGDFFLPLEYIRVVLRKNHDYDEVIFNLLFDWKDQLNNPNLSDYNVLRISEICILLDKQYTSKTLDIMLWCLHLSNRAAHMVISEFVPFVKKLKEVESSDTILMIFKEIFNFVYREEEAFHSKEIKFNYDQYWVTEVFKEIKDVIQSNPLPYFEHLVNEYSKILKIIHPLKDDLYYNDYSNVARPAIEKSRYNLGVSTQDTIITMLRDIIDLTNDKENSELILNVLSKQEYPIFKRLAVYLFGERFDFLDNKYEEMFINSEMFSDYTVSHELWEVIRKRYSELQNPQIIDEILSEGHQQLRSDLEPERIERANWQWKHKWLLAIQKNSPTNERGAKIKDFERKLGYEPEHPEYEVGYSESRSGWDSPYTVEELSSMDWQEIKQCLLDFDEAKAKNTFSFQPEYEGLRRAFQVVIKKRRDEFIDHLDLFKDVNLRKLYLGTVPDGILPEDDVYRHEYLAVCVDYLNWVLDEVESGNLNFEDQHIFRFQYGFGKYFSYLSDLNRNKNNKISIEDSKILIDILIRFNKIAYKQVFQDLELVEAEQSFINRTEGDYWQAWIGLNFMVYRYTEKPEILTEFRKLLTENIGNDIYVNYLLGRHTANFYFLDKEWMLDHIQDIFPESKNKHKLWLAAMKAFLWTRSLRDELFPYLMPNIIRFCNEELDEREQTALGDRIGFYYLRNKTHSNCNQNLIKKIENCYEKHPKIFSSMIHFHVRSYSEEFNIGKRVRKYIRYRYSIIKENPDNYKDELEAIIFTYKCFPEMNYPDYLIIRKAFEKTDMNTRSLEIMELYTFFREKGLFRYLVHLLGFTLRDNSFPSY